MAHYTKFSVGPCWRRLSLVVVLLVVGFGVVVGALVVGEGDVVATAVVLLVVGLVVVLLVVREGDVVATASVVDRAVEVDGGVDGAGAIHDPSVEVVLVIVLVLDVTVVLVTLAHLGQIIQPRPRGEIPDRQKIVPAGTTLRGP